MENVLVFVLSLIAVLSHAEHETGWELTQAEVEQIRDDAACMAVPTDAAIDLEESRGYPDIRPEYVWENWKEHKTGT